MSLTHEAAVDELTTVITDAWTPTTHLIILPDEDKDKPATQTPWAQVVIRHAGGGQRTLSGNSNSRMFNRIGIAIIMVFTPIGNGLQESYQLAKVLTDAFEGKSTPGGMWFREVRIDEIGRSGTYQQLNVIAEFTYDEIK